MSACNFEYLLQFVNDQLDPDRQLEVYDHLDRCKICRDAVCQISRDLNKGVFIYCSHCAKHYGHRRRAGTAPSSRAHVSANTLARPAMRSSVNRP